MIQLFLLVVALSAQESQKPLPNPAQFLSEFRKTLHSDSTLLGQYTYTETEQQIALDSNGKQKKTETSVYQVLHKMASGDPYRRLLSKNGVAISEQQIAKQDRKEEEQERKEKQKNDSQSEAKRQQEKAKEDREEQEALNDVFAMYDVQILRRESVSGVSTIAISFTAKANYKPKTSDGKILQHIGGRAWIAEEDHELVRLEAEVNDPISIGGGILAKLQKGSTLTFERRKINNEIWLPVKADVLLNARLLLFKGLNFRQINEYSDHKKYTVDTILKFGEVPPKPVPR
jgi:hypothetical protein